MIKLSTRCLHKDKGVNKGVKLILNLMFGFVVID